MNTYVIPVYSFEFPVATRKDFTIIVIEKKRPAVLHLDLGPGELIVPSFAIVGLPTSIGRKVPVTVHSHNGEGKVPVKIMRA